MPPPTVRLRLYACRRSNRNETDAGDDLSRDATVCVTGRRHRAMRDFMIRGGSDVARLAH